MLLTYSITKAKRALCDVAQLVADSRGAQGGLEALPMIQRVKVRANFHKCKQNLVIIQGKSRVFTWLLLRLGSLL